MRHTKGPWKQLDHDPNWIAKGKRLIAMISDSNGDRNITAQTMANAALIAAAPDMLEALESIMDAFKLENKKTYELPHLDKASFKVRAAINKAKGEIK